MVLVCNFPTEMTSYNAVCSMGVTTFVMTLTPFSESFSFFVADQTKIGPLGWIEAGLDFDIIEFGMCLNAHANQQVLFIPWRFATFDISLKKPRSRLGPRSSAGKSVDQSLVVKGVG